MSESAGGSTLLEALARRRFSNLTPAERRVLQSMQSGSPPVICGPNDDDNDPANDLSKAAQWSPERDLRAELIRWLCVDPQAQPLIDPRGILVYGARISGKLDLSYANVAFAISLQHSYFAEEIRLVRGRFRTFGLQHSWIKSLVADGAEFKGDVLLREGFRCNGIVRLVGARIDGTLSFVRAEVINPPNSHDNVSNAAILADSLVTTGSVMFQDGFASQGQVRLRSASIGGDLNCGGATFSNPQIAATDASGVALDVIDSTIKGNVWLTSVLDKRFFADGTVILTRASVGSDLICSEGAIKCPPGEQGKLGVALLADGITVAGTTHFFGSFYSYGHLRFVGGHFAGQVSFDHFHIYGLVLLDGSVINRDLHWTNIGNPQDAGLSLLNVSAERFVDDTASWPPAKRLLLDGFQYRELSSDSGANSADSRLKWLSLTDAFGPQPYQQLAEVLSRSGDESGARQVLIEMERQLRSHDGISSPVLRWTTGYGYEPLRSFWGLMAISGVGWLIYRRAHLARAMVPTDKDANVTYRQTGDLPAHYPRFAPAIYSLENSIPLVKLGQVDKWQPSPVSTVATPMTTSAAAPAAGSHQKTSATDWSLEWLYSPRFLRRFLWLQIVLGWILATLLAAGVAGLIHSK